MKKKASELIFISRINRDGSGTTPVSEDEIESMINYRDKLKITCLSLIKKTFIASGFNSFVVKLKTDEIDQDKINQIEVKGLVESNTKGNIKNVEGKKRLAPPPPPIKTK